MPDSNRIYKKLGSALFMIIIIWSLFDSNWNVKRIMKSSNLWNVCHTNKLNKTNQDSQSPRCSLLMKSIVLIFNGFPYSFCILISASINLSYVDLESSPLRIYWWIIADKADFYYIPDWVLFPIGNVFGDLAVGAQPIL